ncbi:hypothetical protein [Shinella sp.]|uniref:hypothetical protein n=1 Tax=Shinella sp. TaxID=1870904 RepID=UPI003D2AB598
MKLTPTMLAGLRKMALKLKRQSSTLAEPNENTGRALAKRGLVELAADGPRNGWNYYVLTDAGRAELARAEELGL